MFYTITLKSGILTKYAGKFYGINKADAIEHFKIYNANNYNWSYDEIIAE